MKSIKDYVITIPDFPKKGIMFRDITSVLQSVDGFSLAIDQMLERVSDLEFDAIACLESRGFMFAAPLAYQLHKPLIPIRKQGKLPRKVVSEEYELEYGTAVLELHEDAITPGQRVLLIDDLLATGGTMLAGAHLIEKLGGKVVKMLLPLELKGLNAREKLKDYDVDVLASYDGI